MSRFSMYVCPKGDDMHTDLINVPGGWAPLRCYTNISLHGMLSPRRVRVELRPALQLGVK